MDTPDPAAVAALVQTVLRSGFFQPSFSQIGEDRLLWLLLGSRLGGFYVDIGCHRPFRLSNTALLHIARGWNGVNVDVDARVIADFAAARPDDVNVCAAVGSPGRREVTLFEGGATNTLDPVMAADPRWPGRLGTTMVDVLPLATILERHVPPGQVIDLLNVDIEGLDHEALLSNDWARFRPEVIAVEAHGFKLAHAGNHPTFQLLTGHGYGLVAHIFATSVYRRQAQ